MKRAAQAYNGINIKLMKCAGLHEAYKMAVLARALGMKVMLGCMTETASCHFCCRTGAPMADWADLDGNLLISNDILMEPKSLLVKSLYPGIAWNRRQANQGLKFIHFQRS